MEKIKSIIQKMGLEHYILVFIVVASIAAFAVEIGAPSDDEPFIPGVNMPTLPLTPHKPEGHHGN